MKRFTLVVLLVFFAVGLSAQQRPQENVSTSLIFSAGYVPKSSYNAMKFGVTVNDLLFERFGAYVSFESGMDSEYFRNLYGITGRIHDKFYLWGGIDLFTKGGLFTKGLNARKEFGLSYVPHPNIVLMPGYSLQVGFSMQVGFRIPLMYVTD
jgi:hypothetical protein